MVGLYTAYQPFPKAQRFGMRIIDTKDVDAMADPEFDNSF
jgi:hypothetical protein